MLNPHKLSIENNNFTELLLQYDITMFSNKTSNIKNIRHHVIEIIFLTPNQQYQNILCSLLAHKTISIIKQEKYVMCTVNN